jgi:hypothetical protein
MTPRAVALLVVVLLVAGCTQEGGRSRQPAEAKLGARAPLPPGAGEISGAALEAQEGNAKGQFVKHKEAAQEPGQGPPKKAERVERKIKYTGTLQVICDDFDKAEDGLKAAIKAHQGLVAHSEITASPGAPRSGVWRVRVPIPQFDAFREAVLALGKAERNTADSEDLTEAYYDLENHIKNKLAEEESLRKLLEKSGGEKMENILAIRRELAAVRDDINRHQGRLKLMANLTDLTTVTVTLREKQKYEPTPPPDITETPAFGTRIGYTFSKSWEALVTFVQYVVLAAVGAAPWLMPAALVAVAAFVIARIRARRIPVVTPVAPPTPPAPAS